MDPKKALAMIGNEHHIAEMSFKPFNTTHEGWAVIQEEMDELWAEIKNDKRGDVRTVRIRAEACQVAAMALRLMQDCT
jgi:hypothetical protein